MNWLVSRCNRCGGNLRYEEGFIICLACGYEQDLHQDEVLRVNSLQSNFNFETCYGYNLRPDRRESADNSSDYDITLNSD